MTLTRPGTDSSPTALLPDPFSADDLPLRQELCGPAQLDELAHRLAACARTIDRPPGRKLLERASRNHRVLLDTYGRLTRAAAANEPLTGEAEWLLDNFYVIEEVLREVQHDLPRGYYHELPALADGPCAGLPRVYALAVTLLAHTDSSLNEGVILRFVRAYQEKTPLTIGELWAVPTMLRIALLENLARLAGQMERVRRRHEDALAWVGRRAGGLAVPLPDSPDPDFVVGLLRAMGEHPEAAAGLTEQVRDWLARAGLDQTDLLRRAHQGQAANQVSIGNSVTSLRLLSALDWNAFFEQTSPVEEVLRGDPADVYRRMDFATRDSYRRAVERLARGAKRDELAVAREVVERARQAASDPHAGHVGHYLVGPGREAFAGELGYRPALRDAVRLALLRHPNLAYFGTLTLLLAGLLLLLVWAVGPAGWLAGVGVLLVGLLPASQLAVSLLHDLICRALPPRVLPKLDFSRGIAPDCPTFVVIPGMLFRPDSAKALLDRLELHYLANPDPQLRFAILTDFADAPRESMPEDEGLVQAALDGVRALNERHAAGGPPRFFIFHRKRLYNPSQKCWMGWERKRGKLHEFNRLLRGAKDTSYVAQSGDLALLPRIRYVLTLDADTHLPRDAALAMVGALAHPLNQARLGDDGRRVVEGYGILQPRVSFLDRTGRRSPFARAFAYSAGIDPYAVAVSDPYMDLFGRGSFTGKGLYDVDAFEATAGRAFPENHILSHDLIESNFARCGLITDVEVFDDFPSGYPAYARREHRWVRGDWQLLPWLAPTVPTADGRSPNVLPPLERWKIVDNLRRSLVPPALLVLLALGWTVLPAGALFWSLLALALVLSPVFLQLGHSLLRLAGPGARAELANVRSTMPSTLAQAGLSAVFLAHQAVNSLDAIGRTLGRLFVTRGHLLEWETAAVTEQRLGSGLRNFIRYLFSSIAVAVALGAVVVWVDPLALLPAAPWLAAWLIAPLVAWLVSKPAPQREVPLAEGERHQLRLHARRIWGFFEAFVGPDDHWQPPDNYQEAPKEVLASRTSPTNQGLLLVSTLAAHDFGYLSLFELRDRISKTFETFRKLGRYRGHFFNWYDTRTLHPLQPAYVSTVDSGNLMACLLTLKHGLREKLDEVYPNPAVAAGLRDTLALLSEAFRAARPAETAPQAHDWRELQEELEDLRRRLAAEPQDLPGWEELLARVAARSARWLRRADAMRVGSPEVHRWATHFAELANCRHRELHLLYPWVPKLPEAAEAGKSALPDRPHSPRELARGAGCQPPPLGDGQVGSLCHAPALVRELEALADAADDFAEAMDFRFLYNESRHLFAIGYHVPLERLDQAHYDLLASEACLTSFLTIARGDVHRKHWFQLGRPYVLVDGQPGLVSWGGTMFEYMMPRLFLKAPQGALLDQAQRAAVARQIEYGRQTGVPWGVSESGFNLTDAAGNYQYQAFGVPGLGLKRGLNRDLVVAPYATFLALPVDPHAAVRNLAHLARVGALGAYGFHEAIDYTSDRLPPKEERAVVRSYMAHHQGMSLVALANLLLGEVMPRRLAAEPMVRAVDLLLQERVPAEVPFVHTHEDEEAGPPPHAADDGVSRRLTTAATALPRPHLLSNGEYALMLTNAGGGYSRCRGLDVSRWRNDPTADHWGQFCYVRDHSSRQVWSVCHQPVGRKPDWYEVLYAVDKAEFRRRDGDVETHLEVAVSPESNVEARRVRLVNHGLRAHELELTSYLELSLAPHGADVAHPAFQKLFLETEYVESAHALLCRRRPRSKDEQPVWAVHVLSTDASPARPVEYETDRMRFLGRRRTPADPAALEFGSGKLSGTTGPTLDPIFSLRVRLVIPPGSHAVVAFSTAVAFKREEALALADRLDAMHAVSRVFELAWAHSRFDLRHRGLSIRDAHLFQRLAGHVLFPGQSQRAPQAVLEANQQGQPGLWRHGISGDLPIVLVRIRDGREDNELMRQVLAAHAFWASRGLVADLVLLDESPTSYQDSLKQQVLGLIRSAETYDRIDRPGGIFVRKADQFSPDDLVLLQAAARVILAGDRGTLEDQVNLAERRPRLPVPRRAQPVTQPEKGEEAAKPQLRFFNGFGGFSADGREYVVPAGSPAPPAPWVNVVANPAFGFLVSDSGAGYTWACNSQLNRLTPWRNDPVSDEPGEVIYLRDEGSGDFWTPTPSPLPGGPTAVRHGWGYSVFEQGRGGLEQELTLLVPEKDPLKILRLRIRNHSDRRARLAVTFYAEWVLGTDRGKTAGHVITSEDDASGALLARNAFNSDFAPAVAFADVSRRPRTLSGDRAEFLGRNGSLADPAALHRAELSGVTGAGLDPCAALQTVVEVRPGEETEVVFLLGETADVNEARRLLGAYRSPEQVEAALQSVKARWRRILERVQVHTPDPAFDLLMNGWLLYQTVSCRLWGRTGFYQSGGAYGFRDQLQDVMALVHAAPEMTRDQILRCARHQFGEGDVQHWWHPFGRVNHSSPPPSTSRGVRARFSDDFLWLPFVTCHYVRSTGDEGVLDEKVPFLDAPPLPPNENEVYGPAQVGHQSAALYEHCARALDHGWKLGPHGLPLMGIGDWNDGMNRVGVGGKGESVWVAWFQIACLTGFAELAARRGDGERERSCKERVEQLRRAVEEHAWDGEWYRRAYFDDGTPLGSRQNDECQIDSIAQSWAVLAGNTDEKRAAQAVQSAVERLVMPGERLALLFTPPFDAGPLQPGYIKGYPPGIRENGGQYTHAATWLVLALARLGRHDDAYALFDLLNPIRHARTEEAAALYRVEPYAVAGDVYSRRPHVGRGGWTWYTGSAGWMYQVGLEAVLGLRREGQAVVLKGKLPSGWQKAEIEYRSEDTAHRWEITGGAPIKRRLNLRDGEVSA
jgi:cyclic beta-1,2-glucan synthetase